MKPPIKSGEKKKYQILNSLYSSELIKSLREAWDTSIQCLAKGRYDFSFDYEEAFIRSDFLKPKRVVDIIEKEIGSDYKSYSGALTSEVGSKDGEWHRDSYILFNEELDAKLPPFYFTLLVALDDINKENGPTEIKTGSKTILATMKAGDALLLDGRVWHRGTGNKSNQERRMLYIVYCKNWYNDYI